MQPQTPAVVQAWIDQLTDPAFLAIVAVAPERIDVRLSASRGKVRRAPEIVFNGGSMEFKDINDTPKQG